MFQDFLMKQMLKKQLSALPEEQRQKILSAFDDNPDFFKGLMSEIGERLKKGESQQTAIMNVMMKYKSELQKMLQS